MTEIYRLDTPGVVEARYRSNDPGAALTNFWFFQRDPGTGQPTGAISRKLMTVIFPDGVFGVRVKK